MLFLMNSGRIALAQAVAARPITVAIGRGLPAWDALPEPPPATETALVDEVGRRLVTDIQFVIPDPDGGIEMPSGNRYTIVAQPSPYLFISATFGYSDAVGEPIREVGVFLDAQMVAGLPSGQRYFSADQVANGGLAYGIERRALSTRTGSVSTLEQFVLPF